MATLSPPGPSLFMSGAMLPMLVKGNLFSPVRRGSADNSCACKADISGVIVTLGAISLVSALGSDMASGAGTFSPFFFNLSLILF